jgi:hypothetical protein
MSSDPDRMLEIPRAHEAACRDGWRSRFAGEVRGGGKSQARAVGKSGNGQAHPPLAFCPHSKTKFS